MKRSELNQIMKNAVEFIGEHKFLLPPFAFFSAEDWQTKGHDYDEIRDNMLGWQANTQRTCAQPVVLGLCPKLKYPPFHGGIFIGAGKRT